MRRMIVVLAVMLTAEGCTTNTAIDEIRDRDWKLVWVEGFSAMPGSGSVPTIRLGSDGRLDGNTGCNAAGASYTTEGDRLTVDVLLVTKRACLERERNALERAYIAAVQRTRRVRIVADQLELIGEAGTLLAKFR